MRLRLSRRVRANDLAGDMMDKWLARLDHVQVDLATRADARLAERDATLLRVTFPAWRASTSRVSRLTLAAGGVHRTRLLVRALENWRGRVERERVQGSKADVVRDFMVLRGAWRKWTEREWERRRAGWEAAKRKERVREAWQCEFFASRFSGSRKKRR